jgi:levansucrase
MLIAKDQNNLENAANCSHWSASDVAQIAKNAIPEIALIGAQNVRPAIADLALWDIWPVQLDEGQVAEVGGGSLWVMLSAPRRDDPNLRHDEARMRLLWKQSGDAQSVHDIVWRDCGNLLPDDFAPGSREWSGSTRLDPVTGKLSLWFTAAGRRGQAADFEQRLFQVSGILDLSGELPRVTGWRDLTQSVINDGSQYADLAITQGVAGQIKGFRDPYWFRDPADGKGYLLFTGSKPTEQSQSSYDGVVGIAAANDDNGNSTAGFTLLSAIVDADGVANELERPHVFVHDGLYYLFWSSQCQIFNPEGPVGPTGLYGMVAESLFGPYQPLNGTGLVLANPAKEPRQAYAWQVLPSLEVISFVDFWGVEGLDLEADPVLKARQFGGTIAPMVTIALDGSTTRIVANPV